MLHLFVRTAGGEVHLPSPKSPGQRLLVVVKDKALIVTTKLFFWNRVSHLWFEYSEGWISSGDSPPARCGREQVPSKTQQFSALRSLPLEPSPRPP